MTCCGEPCLIRVHENGGWYWKCINCKTLTPA